jgi:hypothetical protein
VWTIRDQTPHGTTTTPHDNNASRPYRRRTLSCAVSVLPDSEVERPLKQRDEEE